MNPLIIDIVLAVIAVVLIWNGYRQGFIRAAGNLLGLVISIAVGIWGVTWLEHLTGFNLTGNPVTFVAVFLVLTIIVSQLLRLVVSGLDLMRRALSIIPFVGLINSLLGTVLGCVQAAVFIALVAYVSFQFLPVGEVKQTVLGSYVVGQAITLEKTFGILR
ncbi:MAG: CvpA family protein [Patescibacteria group bacterium]